MENSLLNQIVLLYCMLLVKCEIFHIKESEESFYPYLDTCLILAQFTDNSNEYIQWNTTLILLPGTHYLNEVLSVTNVSRFEILALDYYSTFEQENGSVHIVCNSEAFFEFLLCDSVHFTQVTFINCGGSIVSNVGTFSLYNSTLIGQNITKSAFTFNYTHQVIINNSYFISNRGSSLQSLFIPEGVYRYSTGPYCGAICAISSNILIVKTEFIKNIQAIFAQQNTSVTIDSSKYEQNMILPVQIGLASSCLVADSSTEINVQKSSFVNNTVGGVLRIVASTLIVENSNFSNNDGRNISGGGSIVSYDSTVYLFQSRFTYNNAPYGGVVYSSSSTMYVNQSRFYYNTADYYGGVFYTGTCNLSITLSSFSRNSAYAASVLVVIEGNIIISSTKFKTNGFNTTEGGVIQALSASLKITRVKFIANTAISSGVILLDQCNFTSIRVSFCNNTSKYNGIFFSEKSVVEFHDTLFFYNIGNFSVIYLIETVATFSKFNFSNNIGSLLALRSKLFFAIKSIFRHNKPSNNSHEDLLLRRAQYQGGSITVFHGSVEFHGKIYFVRNKADKGGALYVVKSTVSVYAYLLVFMNKANGNGGGIYLYQSDFQCNDLCNISNNIAMNEGGGIYTSSGSVNVGAIGYVTMSDRIPHHTINIVNNKAKLGGGIYLTDNAKLYYLIESQPFIFKSEHIIFFTRNFADYGGALYVKDNTTSSTCHSLSYNEYSPSTECFFQTLYTGKVYNDSSRHAWSLRFSDNIANFRGLVLFGGLLDRCSLSPFIEHSKGEDQFNGLTYLDVLSKLSDTYFHNISSLPVRLCI